MTRAQLVAIVHDCAIFLGITLVAGFITGFITALAKVSAEHQHWWLVGTDLLMGTVAIAWIATRSLRSASHFFQLGALLWVLGLLGIVLGIYTPSKWGMSGVTIAVEIGLGIALARVARQKSLSTSKGAT